MTLLSLDAVSCQFPAGKGRVLKAVDRVSLEIEAGQTHALVGESGCGKSTLAKLVLGLERLHAGRILFDGLDVSDLDRSGRRQFRSRVQAVFQDPYSSLNPRLRISSILAEPLKVQGVARKELGLKVAQALERVGLPGATGHLYPHEFSGGQRQRIAIARALILNPDLIVLDEPISALDVSIRAQILNLLQDLQSELNLSYLLIAHDLALVEHASDQLAVMYLGRIVESGPAEDVFRQPAHPYTRALLAAVPRPDPGIRRVSDEVSGEIASALNLPEGCAFSPRCPRANDLCRREPPRLRALRDRCAVACHLAD